MAPEPASISTNSFGSRVATATVRVSASTTTPSAAWPTGMIRPTGVSLGGSAFCGSAAGGSPAIGGRLPSVGTPGGSRPVVVDAVRGAAASW